MHNMQADREQELRRIAHSLDFLTEAEIATLGNFTPTSIKVLRSRGDLPTSVRFGRERLYPRAAVSAFLASRMKPKHATA